MPLHKPLPAVGSSDAVRRVGAYSDASASPSSTLWVGNFPPETTDPELMAVFSVHGALGCTTMHQGSRVYSFVYFRSVDEAKKTKEALEGAKINGSEIKIEFARPAKASKQLWVGGFSSSMTKEQLGDEFIKFGKIEDYKFFRDGNSAIIEFNKMEDAITAHKSMNGKCLDGEQIRIDFLRSQPRRELPYRRDSRINYFGSRNLGPSQHLMPLDDMRTFDDSFHLGSKRPMPSGGRPDSYPSNILWVGYPPSVQIDEQMLHNAMILFGEIERINCFPSRHYAFVEFRSVDEARRAKEGLEGRLFNNPRIQIHFSNSDFAPPILDEAPPFRGIGGQLESFNHGRTMLPNNYRGPLHPIGLLRPNVPLPGHMGFDPYLAGTDFLEFDGIPQNFNDVDSNNSMPPSWRSHSSAPGVLSSPQGLLRPHLSTPDRWDKFDLREPKRSRTDMSYVNNDHYHAQNFDGLSREEQSFGFSHPDRGSSSHRLPSPGIGRQSVSRNSPSIDYIWRGVIAKGGNHVCHARCIPIGKGVDSPLPEVVNCSARTGLDMLAKHYAEAIGFDIVFFLPDSEEDFSSYTEFLRYLGSKSRAGVAKLDDGTTLFLVPPSEFLTDVLKIRGPERLYGVVLNIPPKPADSAKQQPQETNLPLPSRYTDLRGLSTSENYNAYQREDQSLKVDHNQSLHKEAAYQAIVGRDDSHLAQSIVADHSNSSRPVSKAEFSLTPELIATLASLVPSSTQSKSTGTVQMASVSTAMPVTSASVTGDGSTWYQGLRQEPQVMPVSSLEHSSNLPAQFGQQIVNQTVPQYIPYRNLSAVSEQTVNPIVGSLQAQNPPSMPPPSSSRHLNNYLNPHDGQISADQSNQLYGIHTSSSSLNSYGMLQGANAATHNSTVQTQPTASMGGLIAQGHHMQSGNYASGAGTSQDDADKNQRYQSTLQFAANLLRQIKQQPSSNQGTQGAGNQQ